MRKILSILAVSVIFVAGCEHGFSDIHNDAKGGGYIRARLFLRDTVTGGAVSEKPLAGKVVTISESNTADTIDGLFIDTTDSKGYFTDTRLNPDVSYRLYYTEQDSNGLWYSALLQRVKPNKDTLLIAMPDEQKSNGVVFYCKDSTSSQGAVPGISICLYTSSVLANYQDTTCTGANTLTSDKNGKAWIFDLNSVFQSLSFANHQDSVFAFIHGSFAGHTFKEVKTIHINNTIINRNTVTIK